MSVTATGILQPGEIEQPRGEIRRLLLPTARVFEERAARLEHLASGPSTISGYLALLAGISLAQQAALESMQPLPVPDSTHMERCRAHGMPPLSVMGTRRDPGWRTVLGQIASTVRANGVSNSALRRLAALSPEQVEALSEHVLAGDPSDMDPALSPFIAAALQVIWHHMAMRLTPQAIGSGAAANLCPVCGYAPQASVVRIGAEQGLRYLHCALCGTEWHMVRVKCSNCESTKDVSYLGVAGGSPAVRAEACDACHSYLKIVYQAKDPLADPVADDIASLSLDMLMDEAGYFRSGPNLFLIPGDAPNA